MKNNILPAIKLTMFCILILVVLYSWVVYGIGQLAPNYAKGEIITHHGKTFYSNIGQKFSDDKYFQSRPSSVDYNAAGSGGSNKAPSNAAYLEQVQMRIDTFLVHNPDVKKSEIPVDLITASGSGLDPDISVQAAQVQIKRIALVRGMAPQNVQQLVLSNTEKSFLGIFGPEKVNVLKLNMALDNLK